MLSRPALEAVLWKHADSFLSFQNRKRMNDLMDDILALSPPPDRETLKTLLLQTLPFGQQDYTVLVNKLMTWAGAEPKPKVWCPHLQWKEADGGYWLYQDHMQNPYGHHHTIRFEDHWERCPVQGCAAPRPEPPHAA